MARLLHFQFRRQNYTFTFRVGFLLFWLFFFSIFCVLGSWQLQRYAFKKELLTSYEARLKSAPISFLLLLTEKAETSYSPIIHVEADADKKAVEKHAFDDLQFSSIKLSGHYLNSQLILIQNKKYKDQQGFEVLTPLKISSNNKLVLIDRGWIPENKNHQPPIIKNVIGQQEVTGYIKLLNEKQFILGNNVLSSDPAKSPLIMQRIDIDEIARLTHKTFYPFILRLNPQQAHGFVRDWTLSVSPPQRHLGYAIQWFAMALVLFIAYLCFCIERVKHDENESH